MRPSGSEPIYEPTFGAEYRSLSANARRIDGFQSSETKALEIQAQPAMCALWRAELIDAGVKPPRFPVQNTVVPSRNKVVALAH